MSVLTAQGAGVRHRGRWLFRDLDLAVEPGELVAVVGPPGSGRTTLLLALADRFRLSAGRVTITGTAALGHVPDVEAPEPVFTVAEHVRERLALLGRHRSEAAGVPLHGLDPAVQGRDLTPYQKQVLGLVLAGLSRPDLLALDGFDAGLDTAEQADLSRLLTELTAAGTAVLITAREVDPARVSTVIRLGATPPGPAPAPEQTEWSHPTQTHQANPPADVGEGPDPVANAIEDSKPVADDESRGGSVSGDGVPRAEPVAEDGAQVVREEEPAADDGAGTTPADEAGRNGAKS